MTADGISEKLAEKRKRGRPKGYERQFMDALPSYLRPEGGTRTKTDWAFMMPVQGPLQKADTDTQRAILGCTADELKAGTHSWPRGFKTAAVEAGRYLKATGADAGTVLRVIADARKAGTPWADIAAHYRRLRLGDRKGNAWTLTKALARTLDEYRRRFPKTPPEQTRAAVENLLDLLDKTKGDA